MPNQPRSEHRRPADRLPEAVLWDMDGTLVDTEPYWIAAEADLVTRYGGRWTREDGLGLVGNALPVSARIMQEAGVDMSVEDIIDTLIGRVASQVAARPPWCPGALDLLTSLRDARVPCALVTMSYRTLAEPVLARVPRGAMTVAVTGEEVTHGKPHPEPYLTAAGLLGVDIERCVALEDSVPGIASALASGARTIAIEGHVPVPARAGLSRVPSLEPVDLDVIARVVNGTPLDLLADTGA